MCLEMILRGMTDDLKNRTKPIRCYKVLHAEGEGKYCSMSYEFLWKLGEKAESSRTGKKPTTLRVTEVAKSEVNKGFHFFLTREEARKYKTLYKDLSPKIVEFSVDPKDVVAAGTTVFLRLSSDMRAFSLYEMVAHKATPIREVR